MNHECLATLWYSIKQGDDHISSMLTKPEFREFLHPGELELLRRIMSIAKEYRRIENFIDSVTNPMPTFSSEVQLCEPEEQEEPQTKPSTELQSVHSGMYMAAFCQGLTEVLSEYLEEVSQLETTFLMNKQFSLVYALGALEKFKTLFSTLMSIISVIKIEDVYGCLLIGRLHRYIDCGIMPIEKASRQIILSVNKMFYNQLANWIIFGNIKDMYEEFFIYDCNTDDEEFLYEWEIVQNTQSQSQSQSVESLHQHHVPKLKSRYKVQKFAIRVNLLPSVMLPETAENILFMGRMVWILQNDPRHGVLPMALRDDIWRGQTMRRIHEIQMMETEPFDRSRFGKKMEEYRVILSKYLWTVMTAEANLRDNLQMIRDYYCLGRGELFQQFIMTAEEQLREIPDHYIIKNLNYTFNDIGRKIYSSNDHSYTRFELVVPYHMSLEEFAKNPLGNLEMYFEIEWPLHIIFRPKVVMLFNKVFSFLMRVKKTHIDLHQLWLKHMGTKRVDSAIWKLRHNLMFLINNLQYYLQVDVIEAQFAILNESIKNANEYSDIVRMHSIFVSNLLSRTFVMTINELDKGAHFNLLQLQSLDFDIKPKVYNIVICLLELCDGFCLLATNWNPALKALERRQLEDIQLNLDTILENLFRALHSLHEKVSGPHLLQLLHRLDFNQWFTRSKPDLNLSVA